MIYSKLYLQKKTSLVPLFVVWGICLLFLGLVIRSQKTSFQTPVISETLKRREIVNLTSNQIGIFWESASAEGGWVRYGEKEDELDKIAYDERDLAPATLAYTYHYAVLKNLKANTDYYYQIVNSKGAYADNRSKPFFMKTPHQNSQKYSFKPAYGKATLASGLSARNIFVLLQIEDKRPLLVLTKETGEWLIPLHILVDRMSGKIVSDISDKLKVEIEYLGEGNQSSIVTSTLAGIAPMQQTIVLGKNYRLLAKGEVLAATDKESSGSKPVFFVSYPIENGIIPASRPLINGGGIPGNDVFVFINSKPQFAFRTNVDKSGKWRVLPDTPMGAGTYIATVTSKDERGGKVTVQRNFTIAKSGEQVLGVATGEPTLVPTAVISPSLSPTIVITSTPQVTPSPAPSLSVTPKPTLAISPTTVMTYPTVQPSPQTPRTGGSSSIPIITSFSLIIMGVGLMLVF
ncbi:fibronectin type III domain-containing protein [Candidatus Roizmanbacteria bacterium]|nr:fibronectin type III domain-containing protein [Candidatus Roizmanbacteria bacterium]